MHVAQLQRGACLGVLALLVFGLFVQVCQTSPHTHHLALLTNSSVKHAEGLKEPETLNREPESLNREAESLKREP